MTLNPNIINCIYFECKILRMIRCSKSTGTYPWPSPKLGTAVLNMSNFELLLQSENPGKSRAIGWKDVNF